MASVSLKNCTKWDEHEDNDIKHCYRADKTTTLLEPSLKVLFINFRLGATPKYYWISQK